MKIALLTDGIFPYVIGGMQKHSYCLVRYFVRSGIDVDLYHFNQSNKNIDLLELFSEEEKRHICSIEVPFPEAGMLPGHYLRESFEYSRRVYQEFKRKDPVDYIYAKGFAAWYLLDQKRKGVKMPPVGVNFHGYEMFQPAPSWKSVPGQYLLRAPVGFNIRHADHVFSYGGKITSLIRTLGIPEEKIIEVPAGIETEWLSEERRVTQSPRRFIFVGRYERRKGIEELNKVILGWKGKPFEIIFVGPIPVEKQIKHEGLTYTGNIRDQEEMKAIMRKSDVLICPSHSEGMPNVILEGMSCGLAVIATDVGAVSAMVDKDNGWLISPNSELELAIAMEDALEIADTGLKTKQINSLGKVKEQFLWEQLIKTTIKRITENIGA
jgi:glycosyltransferase involved in cell wall biosynthesis